MDPLTLSALIAGGGHVLDIFGQNQANKTNVKLAREQMQFQERMSHSAQAFSERMSSTAAQRAVEDYRKAGLNPALAYGQPASSPTGVTAGGSMARVENAMKNAPQIAASALQLKSMAQEIRQSAERRQDESALLDAQRKAALENASKTAKEIQMLNQQWSFNDLIQPHMIREKSATASLQEYGIAAAKNQSDLEKLLGEKLMGGGTGAKFIFALMQALKGIIK